MDMFSEVPSQTLSAADRLVSIAEIIAAYGRMLLVDAADHMLGIAEHLAGPGDHIGVERIFDALRRMLPTPEGAYLASDRIAAGCRY